MIEKHLLVLLSITLLLSCTKQTVHINQNKKLVDTKWVITRYDTQNNTTVTPKDTLHFVDTDEYTVNGGTERRYTLGVVMYENKHTLTFYDCTTLGGTYTGRVLSTFVDDGEISNSEFVELYGSDSLRVWIEKH
jgi:hypothetical protein